MWYNLKFTNIKWERDKHVKIDYKKMLVFAAKIYMYTHTCSCLSLRNSYVSCMIMFYSSNNNLCTFVAAIFCQLKHVVHLLTQSWHLSGMEGEQWRDYCIVLLHNHLHDQDPPSQSNASPSYMHAHCCEDVPIMQLSM